MDSSDKNIFIKDLFNPIQYKKQLNHKNVIKDKIIRNIIIEVTKIEENFGEENVIKLINEIENLNSFDYKTIEFVFKRFYQKYSNYKKEKEIINNLFNKISEKEIDKLTYLNIIFICLFKKGPLKVNSIYKFFQKEFNWFINNKKSIAWKGMIRQVLSKNKQFHVINRINGTKKCIWAINLSFFSNNMLYN